MPNPTIKKTVSAVLLSSVCWPAMAVAADVTPASYYMQAAAQTKPGNAVIDIPAGDLRAALDTYIRETGSQLIYRADDVSGISTKGAQGQLSAQEALDSILANTGLTVHRDPSGAMVVTRKTDRRAGVVPALHNAVADGTATPSGISPSAPVGPAAAAASTVSDGLDLQEIVVTGFTSRNRPLITSSVDATYADEADLARKAPRSLAETLELIPGIFVEGTAGNVSNNYSVRGLAGGGQRFITLEEDGMPVIYGGGGADEFLAQNLTIDRMEAVRGGTSGILSVNGAAATVNFISRRPNFIGSEGIARVTGSSYGNRRVDLYYSAPIEKDLAFNIGGHMESNPGIRKSSFRYDTYHIKGAVEKQWDDGTWLRVTAKYGDQHDAYYAGMPHRVGANGKPTSVPGMDILEDNIGGQAFGHIEVPVSCATGQCLRPFRLSKGIEAKTAQVRADFEAPINDDFRLFAKARYLDLKWDFNGLFPGSGSGNAGLAPATAYLNGGAASPIAGLLTAGRAAFPNAARFGFMDVTTGQVIASNNTAALNALNGNGLMQQTWLNHDQVAGHDFGSNFGGTYDASWGEIDNSLTVGGMYYHVERRKNQSAVTHVINDVRNNSHIYDVVALDATNNVVGLLTNNGMMSYGDWGTGIWNDYIRSFSIYGNDEMKIGDSLRVDFGLRTEFFHDKVDIGNTASANQPVPAGTVGLARDVGSTFDGTYTTKKGSYTSTSSTVGANYLFTDNLSVYARYAHGFQTNGGDPGGTHKPVTLDLYEAGVRFQNKYIVASVTGFRTDFANQYYNFIDPDNQAVQGSFLADMSTDGLEIDLNLKPVDFLTIDAMGVFQSPNLSKVRLNGVATPAYNGKVPERTPQTLYTITPSFHLPNDLGEVYFRYKYIGKIYADAGNGLALPSYTVLSAGFSVNVTPELNINVSADNLTNEVGLTEGNPRQGQTQSVVGGYFYGRGIAGRNVVASATLRF